MVSDHFRSFQVVSDRFKSFQVVPCFSNHREIYPGKCFGTKEKGTQIKI